MWGMIQHIDWPYVLHSIGNIAIGAGVFFAVSAAMGMMRMPDFYTRLHPAGLMDSMGAPLIILGLALQGATLLASVKLVILILFLLITGPTACHALAKSALGEKRV